MSASLAAYLPQDRRVALIRGEALPERTRGVALLADLSGFTPLTEALDRALGARHGADILTRQINQVYDALISQVDRFDGAVIGFAGDAITCWFDAEGLGIRSLGPVASDGLCADIVIEEDDSAIPGPQPLAPAALRAAACAMAMQAAMRRFAAVPLPDGTTTALALKIAIASGQARRFVVGDPSIQRLDILAGAPLTLVGAGEQLAERGEILADAATVAALGDAATAIEWRQDAQLGSHFAVLRELRIEQVELRITDLDKTVSQFSTLNSQLLKPWLLSAVYERHQAGLGDFMTELRPVTSVFLRFTGIDFVGDSAADDQLDSFIRLVQTTLDRYEGTLLQLTLGDKGSYLHAAFGAPIAHEDDALRAARAVLEWRAMVNDLPFLRPPQIGISHGTLRVGAYGGATRRTYGVLGNEVNIAARLMSRAAPGEALVTGQMQAALAPRFYLESLDAIPLKGLAEPLPVFRLVGERRRPFRMTEPTYLLPMIGRQAELACVAQKIDMALAGHGQVIGITGEAGLGKSRLVAEIIRLARGRGLPGFGGACQSYGVNIPYLVWAPIWRACFDVDPNLPTEEQVRVLAEAARRLAPGRVEGLPLLESLLGLPQRENDFTRPLDPQHRQSVLHSLLLECLRSAASWGAANGTALLFVLEDLHWIDAASHDLLEQVARAVENLPVLLVLAYRPPELLRLQTPRVEALPYFTRLPIEPLSAAEAEQVIRAKLAQLLPERADAATPALVKRIFARAQGNPFYVEELLNYLRGRGIDPRDTRAIEGLQLPASLHTLILSRIDQLSPRQQAELKVASVIGRLFQFAHLHGAFPILGTPELLKADLDELARLELTPLDTPEPELAYLFKHIVTQEVAYNSLTAAARAELHEQLAQYIERLPGADSGRFLNLLAFHYDRSDNQAKKREYQQRAGEAAASRYANDAAIEYLSRAIELTPAADTTEHYALLLAREELYRIEGNQEARAADLRILTQLADALDDDARRAEASMRQAGYAYRVGDYPGAIAAAARAVSLAAAACVPAVAVAAHYRWAWALLQSGDPAAAREQAEAGRALAHASGDPRGECDALEVLGQVAYYLTDYDAARICYQQGLTLARATGDRLAESGALTNLGAVATSQGDSGAARAYYEQGLHIWQEVGDLWGQGYVLLHLGHLAYTEGDYWTARLYFTDSYQLMGAAGDLATEGQLLENLALAAHAQGDNGTAAEFSAQAVAIARTIGNRYTEAFALTARGHALLALGQPVEASEAYEQALDIRRELDLPHLATEPLAGLARVALAAGDTAAALARVEDILAFLRDGSIDGTDEPLRIYLTCYQVLASAGDERAKEILNLAYSQLKERAAAIPVQRTLQMFLEDVPDHRAITQAWSELQSQAPHVSGGHIGRN